MTPEQQPAIKKKRWKLPLLLAVVVLAAVASLWASGVTHTNSLSWLSGVLANVGVTLLLVVPGAWIVHSLSETLQGVKSQASSAQAVADAAASDVADLEQTVEVLAEGAEEIRKELFKQQMEEHQETLLPYEAMKEKADRESLLTALRLGMKDGLISKSGLRAPIWWTESHFRFAIGDQDELVFTIEDHGGQVMSRHVWKPETTAVSFYGELSAEAKALDVHLGPQLFDPTQSIQSAAEGLLYAASETAQKLNPASGRLVNIIEYVEGWYITERGMCLKGNESYFIGKDTLWQMDWEAHIHGKRWDDQNFDEAVAVARALHSAAKPEHVSGRE